MCLSSSSSPLVRLPPVGWFPHVLLIRLNVLFLHQLGNLITSDRCCLSMSVSGPVGLALVLVSVSFVFGPLSVSVVGGGRRRRRRLCCLCVVAA